MRWQWSTFSDLSVFDLYEVLALRQAVFVVEQDCAYLDADGADQKALHLLGWTSPDTLGLYLRVLPPDPEHPTPRIGRVITHPSVRGTGLGRPLMNEGLRRTWARFGDVAITLSAQSHLSAFYQSLGFVQSGEGYLEDGIPHIPMTHKGP